MLVTLRLEPHGPLGRFGWDLRIQVLTAGLPFVASNMTLTI